jgi:hypothetical protein
MNIFVFDNISIFVVALLLIGFVVLLMSSENNLNFLFTNSSGKFILLSILIFCSSINYWVGIILAIVFILINSYITNISNITNENQTTTPLYSEHFINNSNSDSNILDRERSMTKSSNSLPINKNKDIINDNILANEPDKEGFQSEYTSI